MRYVLLIYGDETTWASMPPEQEAEAMKAWFEYDAWLHEKGWHVAGDALQPTPTATTVRLQDGKPHATDGPFAETKEQLGGYYLLDCQDLDQAIEAASRIPLGPAGAVEIRPIQEFEPLGS